MTTYVYCGKLNSFNPKDIEKLKQTVPPDDFIKGRFYEQSDKYFVTFDGKGSVDRIRRLLYTSDDVEKLRYTKPPEDFIVNKFYKQPDGYFFIAFDENGLVRKIIRMYDDVDESTVGSRIMVYKAWNEYPSYTNVIPYNKMYTRGNYECSFHTTYSCNFLNGKKCGTEDFPCRHIDWNNDVKHSDERLYINNCAVSLIYKWHKGNLVDSKTVRHRLCKDQNGLFYDSKFAGSVPYIKSVEVYANDSSSVYDDLPSDSIEYVC